MAIVAGQDRVNLVPLIDCMFFLILFFLVATRFTPDERAIASLLPPHGTTTGDPSPQPLPTARVTVAIVPPGLPRGLQPSAYARLARAPGDVAEVRVGGSAPVAIDIDALGGHRGEAAAAAELARLHTYLAAELAARETTDAPRADQPEVVIAAYSGLPWSLALAAFDGVRAYERGRETPTDQRAATFRAPPIRGAAGGGIGDELFELVHLR